MTIKPLIVPSGPSARHDPATSPPVVGAARRGLPLTQLHPHRTGVTVYGFGSVDDRGRVADLVAPRAMGWVPGTRLEISATDGLLVIQARADGMISITGRGHLRLPTPVRRWCGLVPGDRVLLVANPVESRLVVHPPVALDRMIAQAHAGLRDGGAA